MVSIGIWRFSDTRLRSAARSSPRLGRRRPAAFRYVLRTVSASAGDRGPACRRRCAGWRNPRRRASLWRARDSVLPVSGTRRHPASCAVDCDKGGGLFLSQKLHRAALVTFRRDRKDALALKARAGSLIATYWKK